MNRKKRWQYLLPLLGLSIAAAGCSGGGNDADTAWKSLDSDEKQALTVAYFDESVFKAQYGDLIREAYPNLDIKVEQIPNLYDGTKTPTELYEAFLREKQPDLLWVNEEVYRDLAYEGNLMSLETAVKQGGFDLEQLHPNVVEALRQLGSGQLYGLSPTFATTALFYNKSLFDQEGIPYPDNRMSWDETLKLADRFSTEGDGGNKQYGLAVDSFGVLANRMAKTGRLTLADAAGEHIGINDKPWKALFQSIADSYWSGGLYLGSLDGANGSDLFLNGQAAMAVSTPDYMNKLSNASWEWGIATAPINPDRPDETTFMNMTDIYAINAKSSHSNVAWNVLKLINSEATAKKMPGIAMGLPARQAIVPDFNGHALAPFYELKPDVSAGDAVASLPLGFIAQMGQLIENHMNSVLSKKTTLDETIEKLQTEGQSLLVSMQQESQDGK
ncbi:ABC transporter substrate-binding protein [Paenibacillus sp. MMS18-CY102]|uniref:ABC transporter substrate-binding protein n=1 Tax=Paenibacillus sp. MMS18-CY102 TaxID=2682849 RepID=UPI001365C241|nr:extracellular solute-binding protein [Paenibacillus sp. MMS18-CY102]MWC28554.1 extracellular solute-binding protein [Paenibacillus sp. MMS18-CY102]